MKSARSTLASPVALIASAQPDLRRSVAETLGSQWNTLEAVGGADALAKLAQEHCELLLLDATLPDLQMQEVRTIVQRRYPEVEIVALDSAAGRAVLGDVPPTPRGEDMLRRFENPADTPNPPVIERALPDSCDDAEPLPGMIGSSPKMRMLFRMVRRVASRNTPVLIKGATGTGKELVASAIHDLSPRKAKPMMTINCAAIPETLLESELFGYVRGAFTGAVQSRIGRIHAAQGGTLFLDEIGEVPLSLQSKLLRFVESGEVQRLGSSDVFRVDARVVAATNVDLERKLDEKLFREDLYYRLSVFPVELPKLSERASDIIPLARYFLRQTGGIEMEISTAATERLLHHSWPGNVRELRHAMERASIMSAPSKTIDVEHIIISERGHN